MLWTLRRTAGPLGRAFGFELTIGHLFVSFNAGWYVFFLNWRGLGFVSLATKPVQFTWWLSGVSK